MCNVYQCFNCWSTLMLATNGGCLMDGWHTPTVKSTVAENLKMISLLTKKAVSVTKHSEFQTISPSAFDSLRHAWNPGWQSIWFLWRDPVLTSTIEMWTNVTGQVPRDSVFAQVIFPLLFDLDDLPRSQICFDLDDLQLSFSIKPRKWFFETQMNPQIFCLCRCM